ncbi:MAG TPA: YcaO-like family protein [Bryobacteraceae bacterium]|jgi:ribosomal protein S12 methylthiotransferase accessory factor
MTRGATQIADWAAASSMVDGVLFSSRREDATLPVCAVAQVRGVRGFGKGATQSEALASALGEAMERYAAARIPWDRFICASLNDLGPSAFDPRWLCLYSNEQYRRRAFPYRPFREDAPLHWIAGYWMDNGEAVYLPAFATYLSADLAREAFCQTTSNGLAAGSNVDEAAKRAALELRERDAFVTSWISCQGAARLGTVPEGERFGRVAARLEAEGVQLETYLVANGDPAFVAVSVGSGDGVRWPAVTLGLGAGFTREDAIDRAILEHGQTGPYLAGIWKKGHARIPKTPSEIHSLEDHALYYCDEAHRSEFDRWRNSATPCAAPRKASGVRIAVADLTPPELQDSPFRVTRALARGLQPIYFGYGFERTYTDRLKKLLAGQPVHAAPLPVC